MFLALRHLEDAEAAAENGLADLVFGDDAAGGGIDQPGVSAQDVGAADQQDLGRVGAVQTADACLKPQGPRAGGAGVEFGLDVFTEDAGELGADGDTLVGGQPDL